MALLVKNPPANTEYLKDMDSSPGSGRAPGGGHGSPSSVLAWSISWTEEPGGLQFTGLQRVRADKTEDAHTLSMRRHWGN